MNKCIKLTQKKYSSRKSPPYPANACKGLIKKGNDGNNYISQANKNGIFKWILASNKQTRKKATVLKRYEIHDNGGRQFLVDVGKNSVTVWKQAFNLKSDSYNEPIELFTIPFQKIWIGDDHLHFGNVAFRANSKGNSILLQKNNRVFVFIGNEIFEFSPAESDSIRDYNSYIGNNDFPYPFAIGEKYTYLMIEKVYIPNEYLDMKKDPYAQYYGHMDKEKRIENHAKPLKRKILQKRIF